MWKIFNLLCFSVLYVSCEVVLSEGTFRKKLNTSSGISVNDLRAEASLPEEILDDDFPIIEPDIKTFSQLYDHFGWTNHSNIDDLNNKKCKEEVKVYFKGLENSTSWAVQMFDASGRYSGEFFFGNDYWFGSKQLCEELTNPDAKQDDRTPFSVQFFVARIAITLSQKLTPSIRYLTLGQCLPSSCNLDDVKSILSQENDEKIYSNITQVRKVPGDYVIWYDMKFQIIAGSSVILVIVAVIASVLELMGRSRSKIKIHSEESEIQNNNNNDHSINPNHTKCHVSGSLETVMGKDYIRQKQKTNYFLKLLLCFSALTNGRKILNVDMISKDSIGCIHGLRFFSIAWIILVHTYLVLFSIGVNKGMRKVTERTFIYQTISNATFSVDTFFFISGLLITLTYFKSEAKKSHSYKEESTATALKNGICKFSYLVFYRFFRLTPAYLFVLGVNLIIQRYVNNASIFFPTVRDDLTCETYWWRNALYINNFFPKEEFCMLWSWYISNDTQFYILTAMLLLIGVRGEKHLKFSGALVCLLIFGSWVMTFVIAMKYNYIARVEAPFALFDELYDKPWLRISPYLVGIITGYYLYKVQYKKIPILLVVVGWSLSLCCLASLVYGLGRNGLEVPVSAFYATLGHTAWAISLAWITVACSFGYGGPLNVLFSCRLFLPLSRLTYCAYLIHPVLMVLTSYMLEGSLRLHQALITVIFCGNVVLSFLAAFLISVFFEAPTVNLLKLI